MVCNDGGFLQIGESNFLPNSKIFIVKTNIDGQFLWDREINIGGHNLGNSAIELDDGYLISGSMNRNSALIKLDKNTGETIFSQTLIMEVQILMSMQYQLQMVLLQLDIKMLKTQIILFIQKVRFSFFS